MRTYSENITAGQTVRFNVPGTFFRLLSTLGAVSITFKRSGSASAEASDMEAGYAEDFDESFDAVEIYSATTQTVKFAIRHGGSMRYDRMAGDVAITNTRGSFNNTAKTVTTTEAQMVAANAARRYLLIQNKDAAGIIYIKFGASAATVANGVRINPGDSWEIQGYAPTDEVRAIGSIASNANVVVVEA